MADEHIGDGGAAPSVGALPLPPADAVAALVARVEHEVSGLWRDALTHDTSQLTQHLAEASHALRRALRDIEHRESIG